MIILKTDPRVATFAARFPSRSRPGEHYDVHRSPDGRWSCECWPFLEDDTCQHVDEARRHVNEARP